MKRLLFILILILLLIPVKTNSHTRKVSKEVLRELGISGLHKITFADSIHFTIYPKYLNTPYKRLINQ